MADADLRPRIVVGLRGVEPAIDFEVPEAAVLRGLPDFDVLAIAAANGRVLVSHDRRTMARAFYDFIHERESPGLILLNQNCPIGRAVEELLTCSQVLIPEELVNRILYLRL